jgi:diguanylate cyclase (GGDEF)-like protein/PAS domain S-box-containing protein
MAIISLFIAVFIPAGYFIIAYQYMGGTVSAEIAFSARSIENLVINNPNSWQFEEIRLREIMERRLSHDVREKRIIRNIRGQIIAQTSEYIQNPMLTFSYPIYDSGTQVAQIEINRSISPLIRRTTVISVFSILTGIMIFLLFRSFPLRAVREAYQTVEENERRLTLALKSGNFGIWDWDIKKNVMLWNDRMYEIYGVSRDSVKVVIEAWQNGIHIDDRDRVLENVRTSVLGGKTYNTEFRIVQPDGGVRHLKADGIAIRDADGKSSRMISLINDITEHKRMEEELKDNEKRYRELSIIDDLTQLYNSRYFYQQLKMEIDRIDRYKQPLTLLLLDLDDFKHFNDTYGHIEGDLVLSRFGGVVKRCLRQTDSVFRYGGEEFTILLPMTTSEDGAVTAERIREECKKENFSPIPGKDVRVTVSIGLAQYKPREEIKAFVHRVDQLMYQAKKNGKDRICAEP